MPWLYQLGTESINSKSRNSGEFLPQSSDLSWAFFLFICYSGSEKTYSNNAGLLAGQLALPRLPRAQGSTPSQLWACSHNVDDLSLNRGSGQTCQRRNYRPCCPNPPCPILWLVRVAYLAGHSLWVSYQITHVPQEGKCKGRSAGHWAAQLHRISPFFRLSPPAALLPPYPATVFLASATWSAMLRSTEGSAYWKKRRQQAILSQLPGGPGSQWACGCPADGGCTIHSSQAPSIWQGWADMDGSTLPAYCGCIFLCSLCVWKPTQNLSGEPYKDTNRHTIQS